MGARGALQRGTYLRRRRHQQQRAASWKGGGGIRGASDNLRDARQPGSGTRSSGLLAGAEESCAGEEGFGVPATTCMTRASLEATQGAQAEAGSAAPEQGSAERAPPKRQLATPRHKSLCPGRPPPQPPAPLPARPPGCAPPAQRGGGRTAGRWEPRRRAGGAGAAQSSFPGRMLRNRRRTLGNLRGTGEAEASCGPAAASCPILRLGHPRQSPIGVRQPLGVQRPPKASGARPTALLVLR